MKRTYYFYIENTWIFLYLMFYVAYNLNLKGIQKARKNCILIAN